MTFQVMAQRARQTVWLRAPVAGNLGAVFAVAVAAATVLAAGPDGLLGRVDAPAWIDAVPALPASPQDATARAYGGDITGQPATLRGFYQPFYDRVDAFAESQKRVFVSASTPQGGEPAMRQAAEANAAKTIAQVNGMPVIAQMGGIEALAKMTPEQRQAAAQQMVRALQQNPAAAMPMAPAASAGPSPDAVRASMAIRQDISRMTQEYVALEIAFQTKDAAITESKGSHQEIAALHGAKAAKIPIVILGEAGRGPDPVQMLALANETATRHRDRAAAELTSRRALVADHSRQLKALASSYQTWLTANRAAILGSTSPEDMLRGTNTLLDVAAYEMRFVDSARRLAEYSEAVTKDVAHHDVECRRLQVQSSR